MTISFGVAVALALAADEAVFRWLRRRVPQGDR